MATGLPVVISTSIDINIQHLKPISFSRQDPSSFDESLLQKIVDQFPDILPIKDFYPTVTSVCSLGKEIPVDLGERNGFIDNLLVTNDGHLVLVETKLYRNPEAVRDAVVQTLEYGIAVNQMSLLNLEARLRRAEKTKSRLVDNETIKDKASNLPSILDDFEIALERYLRTGEILLLVVADGIRTSVERITQWMNEAIQGSIPIKFGLVELRFYELPDGSRIVMPRTLLKTREISRHVVIVDIQNNSLATASASVNDQLDIPGASSKVRPIKIAGPALTKSELLEQVTSDAKPVLSELYSQLESIEMVENTKTAGALRYGVVVPELDDPFLPILNLDKYNIWFNPVKRVKDLLDLDYLIEFRNKLNVIATFWRPDQIEDKSSSGCGVKYSVIKDRIPEMTTIIDDFRRHVISAFEDQNSK